MTTNSPSHSFAPIVNSAAEWRAEMARLNKPGQPSFFHIRTQLPKQGRTNQVLGASRYMNVVLKTYASGGENEIHAHSNEDHVFVILQGGAVFHGPNGETREAGRNDCVLLPAGTFYWFHAKEDREELVMLRIGARAAVGPTDERNAGTRGGSNDVRETHRDRDSW